MQFDEIRWLVAEWMKSRREEFVRPWRARQLRTERFEQEVALFSNDYSTRFDANFTKDPEVGRPFLLVPLRVRASVLLLHGYMAAPMEVRALGEYLYRHGFAVFGQRLKGHGTSPADLAETPWTAWYESVERGRAVLEPIGAPIVIGGFSTGGTLALAASARMEGAFHATFTICAPLHLRKFAAKFAPKIVKVNSFLKRFNWGRPQWEYIENHPENAHINYASNPITGVAQLEYTIQAMRETLPNVKTPLLVMQASEDPTVHPDSAPEIFRVAGSTRKEMILFHRARHGIVNGEGSREVFERLHSWLNTVLEPARVYVSPAPALPEPEPVPLLEPTPAVSEALPHETEPGTAADNVDAVDLADAAGKRS